MYEINSMQTLEFGSMFNQSLNAVQNYEEMWTDIDITSTVPDKAKHSMALTCDDIAHGVRGAVVRVGQYCQGILKIGDKVAVERWEFVNKKDDANGEVVGGDWTRTVLLGDAMLPCNVTFKPGNVQEGSKIFHGNYEWLVNEVRELE